MTEYRRSVAASIALLLTSSPALAQLTDQTQAPNAAGAGIAKTFEEQVDAGEGDLTTPGSSTFIINRDPFRSIRRGRQIFQRKFTRSEGQGAGRQELEGEDVELDQGIVSGLADSCAACHGRPRGAAGSGGTNFSRPDSRDAPHLFGLGLVEQLADEITADLRAIREETVQAAQSAGRTTYKALVSKGVRYGAIGATNLGELLTDRVEGVDADLRIRPFAAHGAFFGIREFITDASHNELGMPIWDPVLAQAQDGDATTLAGMVFDGTIDTVVAPRASSDTDDPDQDGVVDEFPQAAVDHLEFYLLNYFKPGTGPSSSPARNGQRLMRIIGCNGCHVPNMTVERDRRVADVDTRYDRRRGIFNGMFATATPLVTAEDDGLGHPPLQVPNEQPFVVRNFYSDLKRHDLGPNFHEIQFDGTVRTQFVTEPLWGVGTTAPYGHDGRSINLREVILRHGGEAAASRNRFARLSFYNQRSILAFLESLVLFPPDDTASNLDPGDRTAANFPQNGHGSIRLPVLFNDPSEPE